MLLMLQMAQGATGGGAVRQRRGHTEPPKAPCGTALLPPGHRHTTPAPPQTPQCLVPAISFSASEMGPFHNLFSFGFVFFFFGAADNLMQLLLIFAFISQKPKLNSHL